MFLEMKLPPGQRDPAPTAEVTDVIKLAPEQALRAVGRYDGSYLSHAPNLGTPISSPLNLSTTEVATFLVADGLKFLEHIELCDTQETDGSISEPILVGRPVLFF